MGDWRPANYLSEFHLYVGVHSDYTKNTPCPGGPFAYPLSSDYGTWAHETDWPNGAEAWCNLSGHYVTFVRESTALPALNDIVICTFGVISDFDECETISSVTVGP